MANYFNTKGARRHAFLQAAKPLLSQWIMNEGSMLQRVPAYTRTDTTIPVNGTTMVLMEIKNGKTGGEVYTQACRGYKIATEELVEKNTNF